MLEHNEESYKFIHNGRCSPKGVANLFLPLQNQVTRRILSTHIKTDKGEAHVTEITNIIGGSVILGTKLRPCVK